MSVSTCHSTEEFEHKGDALEAVGIINKIHRSDNFILEAIPLFSVNGGESEGRRVKT